MKRALLVSILLLGAWTLTSCGEDEPPLEEPTPLPPGDAGNEAFVRRAVPLLWGRHVLGVRELEVLMQLLEQSDRPTLVRGMTASTEYHRHWEDALADALFVSRIGERANTRCWSRAAAEHPEPDDAFDPAAPPIGPETATWVRDHAPTDPDPPPLWTMSDLIRSSLALDDLSPVWRANLFANLATDKPPLDDAENLDMRRHMAGLLMTTYLDRSADCMPCHNSEHSVTGHDDPEQDRTWEVPGHFELALFGTSGGVALDDLAGLFRRDGVLVGLEVQQGLGAVDGCSARDGAGCENCACEEAVCADNPACCDDLWTGACANDCTQFNADAGNLGLCLPGVPEGFEGCTAVANLPGCGGCACEEAVCEQIPLCCERGWHQGCAELCEQQGSCPELPEPAPEDVPGVKPWGMHYTCGTWFAPTEVNVDPLGQRPWLGGDLGTSASIWDVERLLHDGVDGLRDGLDRGDDLAVPADEAFAWLLAMRLVDVVWQEAFGASLTIAHDFPRNRAQRDTLQSLTERLIATDWSLRELLVEVTSSPWFNAALPTDEDGSPYRMPPVFDPWTPDREADAARQGNGVGDQVGRFPGRVLDKKIARALDWVGLPPFPDASTSGEHRVQEDLGFFLKDSTQGFDGTDVQLLAAWEAWFGSCRMDAWEEVLGIDEGPDDEPDDDEPDFIARLLQANPGATAEDGVAALKDRLLGDPVIEAAERTLLEAVLGGSLDAPADEAALRRACAAFLASPQFLLRGAPTVERRGQFPTLTAPGTSFQDHCSLLAPTLYGDVECGAEALTVR